MRNAEYDQRIFQALQGEKFGLTQRELAEETQMARSTVRSYASEMILDGRIAVEEKAGSLIYYIPDERGERQ